MPKFICENVSPEHWGLSDMSWVAHLKRTDRKDVEVEVAIKRSDKYPGPGYDAMVHIEYSGSTRRRIYYWVDTRKLEKVSMEMHRYDFDEDCDFQSTGEAYKWKCVGVFDETGEIQGDTGLTAEDKAFIPDLISMVPAITGIIRNSNKVLDEAKRLQGELANFVGSLQND